MLELIARIFVRPVLLGIPLEYRDVVLFLQLDSVDGLTDYCGQKENGFRGLLEDRNIG